MSVEEEEEDQDSQSYSSDEDSMDSWYYESLHVNKDTINTINIRYVKRGRMDLNQVNKMQYYIMMKYGDN